MRRVKMDPTQSSASSMDLDMSFILLVNNLDAPTLRIMLLCLLQKSRDSVIQLLVERLAKLGVTEL